MWDIDGVYYCSTGLHIQDTPPYLRTQSIHALTDYWRIIISLATTTYFSAFFRVFVDFAALMLISIIESH